MKYIILLTVIVLFVNVNFSLSQNSSPKFGENFKLQVFLENYYLKSFNKNDDTLNIAAFAGNSKYMDQFRLNVASIALSYDDNKVRGGFEVMFGDNPHLMAYPDNEFVRYIGKANFGYHLTEGLWIDIGYIPDPVGCESGKPINNMISSVSIGGYYQPENFLGFIFSYKMNDKLAFKGYFGNPYTLRFGKNEKSHLGVQVNWKPIEDLSLTYSNLYGDDTELYEVHEEWMLYNNFVLDYRITESVHILGQFDLARQKGVFGDDDRVEIMTSGFLGAKYYLFENFSVAARYEFINDESGFRTGYLIDGRLWSSPDEWQGYGMNMQGLSASLEFIPVDNAYIRAEFRYNETGKDELVFNRNLDNTRKFLLFTTGLKF